jgi:hypothetical protein
MLNVF